MGGGRSPGRTGKPHGIIRYFGRDRLTGQAAIALAGVLVVGALVYGVGAASARYRLSDVGAWLGASAKGLVVHANGPAGKVDGRAELPARMRGHRIEVVQDGTTVLLVDTDTGVVSRIDPAQLEITGSRGLGGPGLQVAVGGGAAYTVDLVKGVVQRIDPVSLAPLGAAATLAAPLGQAGIDGRGALWVPVPQDGRVVPFHGGGPGTPVDVGEPGATLSLTIAAGTPVVVDSTSATAHVVRPEGVQTIRLPAAVAGTRGGVKLPAATDGGVVPMLGAGGSLHLLDTGVGRVESVALRVPDHEFAPPHILGSRVYLPDRTSGRLLVFDTAAGAWREPVAATRPGGAVEALVRDHMLWFNDPDGAFALAFSRDGAVKRVRKYEEDVPGGARRPLPVQADPGGGGDGANTGGGRGGGSGSGGGPSRRPEKPEPTAPEPPIPAASGENGSVVVRFTAAPQPQGVRPITGFALLNAAGRPVAGASPRTHPGTATEGAFTVGGLTCDSTTHVFKVAAVYEDASGKTKFSPSGEVGAAACQAPPPAAGLRAEPVDHGARLTWDASPGHDVTYTVTTPAGTLETQSTSATVGGLRNNARHQVTVTARNGAGTSTPVATTVDLAYPTRQFQNQNNGQTNTIIRSTPGTGGGQNGKIPKDRIVTMTVVCQVRGEPYTDPESGSSSDVWNQVRTPHGDGYLNDTLVRTTKGRGFPSDGLFECEG
ncbi:fibronectin type III domain-containing protein [Actinomadura rifamycini]|uniref:fibronectin type III domain-containing protein n=1 Tax=Actinomadura rifamycini TaxID=31962 RepID=UPI000403B7C7|nr:fibronectin type III domain-containing protein [Actinomadura rifamycini]